MKNEMNLTMTTYTPGPWTLGEAAGTIPIRAGNKTVASVRYGRTDLDDARLIAAAPDMLAALQLFVDKYSRVIPDDVELAAPAAIDKAEGRA